MIVLMVSLQKLYEVTREYCEEDDAHPFLEECVSVQASFLERIGRLDQAYLKWENFLRIQTKLFGQEKEQMVMTYKKLG